MPPVSPSHANVRRCRLCNAVTILLSLTGLRATVEAAPAERAPGATAADSFDDTNVANTRPARGYWSEGIPRWFVSTKSDLGAPYVKPYFSFGYGLPHWLWAGADVNAITTLEFAQVYAGVRASSPILDVAFGVRDTKSFGKSWLAPATSFHRDDVLG